MSVRKDKVQLEVEINGKKAGTTYQELLNNARDLNRELKKLTPGTEEFIRKTAELQKVNTQLKEISQQTRAIGKGLDDIKPKNGGLIQSILGVAGGIGVLEVFGKVKQFFSDTLKFYNTAAKGEAQLQAVLKSTNQEAGRSLSQLQAQAKALQSITLFDDDATQQAQGLLLTFTNVRNVIFDRAVPAIQDMATALATASGEEIDLSKASIQVGKALNDPIKGITALSKVGVSFTEQQKEQIKTLTQSGEITKAQTIILNELNKEFGGSAVAAARADIGFTQLVNRFENLQESIGGLVANGLDPFIALGHDIIGIFEGMIDPVGKATEAFEAQSQKVATLESELPPLLDRYEQLKGKSNLTKIEQAELAKVIQRIGELTPTAITQVDQYGNVMGVSATKSREFLEAQKAILAFDNQDQIKSLGEKEHALRRIVATNQELIAAGKEMIVTNKRLGTVEAVPLSEDRVRQLLDEIKQLGTEADVVQLKIKQLKGEPIATEAPPPPAESNGGEDPEAVAERVKKAQDARLAALEAAYEQEQLIVEGQQIRREISEQEAQERLYQLEKLNLERKLALYNQFGQGQTAKALEVSNKLDEVRVYEADRAQAALDGEIARLEQLGINKEGLHTIQADTEKRIKDEVLAYTGKLYEAEKLKYKEKTEAQAQAQAELSEKLEIINIETLQSLGELFVDFFSQQKKDGKAFLKGFLEIMLSAIQKSVLANIAAATAIEAGTKPFPANLLTTGVKIAAINAAFAVAKAAVKAFAGGGAVISGRRVTESSNIPQRANGDNVLATLRTGEVVLNEGQQAMLGGPAVFRRIGVPGFALGGLVNTTPDSSVAAAVQGSTVSAGTVALERKLDLVNLQLANVTAALRAMPTNLKANVVYTELETKAETLGNIRDEANA